MEAYPYEVYCEMHGDIHGATTDPYQYGYAESGEEPECGPEDWRKIWIGGKYEPQGGSEK